VSETETESTHAERAKSQNRLLNWTEAGLWIALLVVGSLVAMAALRDIDSRKRPPAATRPAPGGLIEAEDLPLIAKSRDFAFWLQPSGGFRGGKWSKDGHMFASGTQQGDWVELRLPEREPGKYALEVFLTKAADYGIVAIYVNEVKLGTFDLLSLRDVVPVGPLRLGEVQLGGSKNLLRFEVVGKNPNAAPPFYQFGIDGIRIREPAKDSDDEPSASKSNSKPVLTDGG
jgi:hypothetical protein